MTAAALEAGVSVVLCGENVIRETFTDDGFFVSACVIDARRNVSGGCAPIAGASCL
jgi:hypothetical protein